jgi:hypothetical protein
MQNTTAITVEYHSRHPRGRMMNAAFIAPGALRMFCPAFPTMTIMFRAMKKTLFAILLDVKKKLLTLYVKTLVA